jgi:2'-5' RNA ligase
MSNSGWSPKEVKPVDVRNFHFTLIFLGEIADVQAEAVKQRLSGVRFEPFDITFTGVGAFPSARNARVVWVGVDQEGARRLSALAEQVVSRMAEAGFRPDKPFSPHLTLFRAKNRHVRVDTGAYEGRTFGTIKVDSVYLKKSELSPSGPTYSNVYTLSAAAAKKKEE